MVGDSFQCIHSAHAAPPLLSGYSLAASSIKRALLLPFPSENSDRQS